MVDDAGFVVEEPVVDAADVGSGCTSFGSRKHDPSAIGVS